MDFMQQLFSLNVTLGPKFKHIFPGSCLIFGKPINIKHAYKLPNCTNNQNEMGCIYIYYLSLT